MSGDYSAEILADLTTRVTGCLPQWNLSAATSISLLNVSENATFALCDPATAREVVLRVHRTGYSSAQEICSELAWIEALRRAAVVETAAPLPGANGEFVQILPATRDGAARHAVAFQRLPGRPPDSDAQAAPWFERLGELNAGMHAHARSWTLPRGFRRRTWNVATMVGPEGHWGPWQAGIGLDAAGAAVLERAVGHIQRRLERYGTEPSRFGLVHADLRLANLLADGEHLRIIDFDDCGFSWFMYDFATAVSFIEHEAAVPRLLDAWLAGYRKVAPLRDEDAAEIPTLIVLRRILLTAWVASHAEVPFARRLGAGYTQGSVMLARRWLAEFS